jgi:HlyD family secretion protein
VKKKALVIGGVALLLAAAGGYLLLRPAPAKPAWKTEKIARGDVRETVAATGTVNPLTTVNVGTQVSGTIREISADFNSRVKKGQIIARIDPSLLAESVKQAEANLSAAQANLDRARSTAEDARRTLERNRDLFTRGLVARSELDSAQTASEGASASVRSAEAQASQAEAALSNAETNLRYTDIASPVDGVVISRAVDVGQTVAASFQTPTLFTIAEDLTRMEIHTSVDEADIGRVREGQTVEFTVDAYPDKPFEGRVFQVRNAPVAVQNVVTYDVVVRVANPDLLLKPGMTANVTILTAEKKGVLLLPAGALRFKMPESAAKTAAPSEKGPPGEPGNGASAAGREGKTGAGAKGSSVWAMVGGAPQRVRFQPGLNDGAFTEVLSGDLLEGQEVLLDANGGTAASGGGSSGRGGGRPPGMHF